MNNKVNNKKRVMRRKRKVRRVISNIICGTVLIAIMLIGMEMFLRTWESEMDAHAEYNNRYQTQLRINGLNNSGY